MAFFVILDLQCSVQIHGFQESTSTVIMFCWWSLCPKLPGGEIVTLSISCMKFIVMQEQPLENKLRLGRKAEQWCACCRDMTATVSPSINPLDSTGHSHTCVLAWKRDSWMKSVPSWKDSGWTGTGWSTVDLYHQQPVCYVSCLYECEGCWGWWAYTICAMVHGALLSATSD